MPPVEVRMKALGIVLVVVGLIGVLWGGITWTDRDTVLDVGPLEVTTEEHERLPFPPVAGGICLAVGAALLIAGSRRRVA
jgi:hypothetical protein